MKSISKFPLIAITPVTVSGIDYAPGDSFTVSDEATRAFLVATAMAAKDDDSTLAAVAPDASKGEQGGAKEEDAAETPTPNTSKGTQDVKPRSGNQTATRRRGG